MPGSLLMLPAGAPAPPNYTYVGTFDLTPSLDSRGRNRRCPSTCIAGTIDAGREREKAPAPGTFQVIAIASFWHSDAVTILEVPLRFRIALPAAHSVCTPKMPRKVWWRVY